MKNKYGVFVQVSFQVYVEVKAKNDYKAREKAEKKALAMVDQSESIEPTSDIQTMPGAAALMEKASVGYPPAVVE